MFGSKFLKKHTTNKTKEPSTEELIMYLFWEKGISLKEFDELPLPYIFNITKTYKYFQEKEKQEMEKNKRKR